MSRLLLDHTPFKLQGIYDVMRGCWEIEPKERPPFPILQQMLAKNFGELGGGRQGEVGCDGEELRLRVQWNPSIRTLLKYGHLSKQDTFFFPEYHVCVLFNL